MQNRFYNELNTLFLLTAMLILHAALNLLLPDRKILASVFKWNIDKIKWKSAL